MTDLLPCPFCGLAFDLTMDGKEFVHPIVPCFGRNISIMSNDPERIAAWNTRTPTPDPRDAVIARLVEADILKAAGEEYILEHVMETDWHRMGRHSTVRGMMVRLGLYPKLDDAIDAAIAAAKAVMK